MVFAAMSAVFRQVSQCFLVALATVVACYLFYRGGKWCDRTLGKVWGKKGCDATKRAVFAALAGCLALMLVGWASGGGFSSYSPGSF